MKENMSQDELKKMRRMSYIKMVAMVGIFVAVIAFSSIAWFTMNREVEGSGVQMRADDLPYEIITRGESGFYKSKYDLLHSDAMEWKISAAHNLDNHSSAKEDDEEEPALEPGDHGSLEYRVNPKSAESITVSSLFEVKAYLEEETVGENNTPTTTISEISDNSLSGFLNAHILLFTGVDATGKYTGLIDNDNENYERLLENQVYRENETTYTTIYWYWPEHLSDLTNADAIYAPSEHDKVIAYIARNKDGFFKDCGKSQTQVQSDLMGLSTNYSNQIYNYYNIRYDNADLDIGNGISYAVLSMEVK